MDTAPNVPHLNDLEELHWITRSDRFYPMDYSKLTLEMSTHDYIHYFYSLSCDIKKQVLQSQQYLYKEINFDLINELYEQLYFRSLDRNNKMSLIKANCELDNPHARSKKYRIAISSPAKRKKINLMTNSVILATGYENTAPDFLNQLTEQINYDEYGNLAINKNYSIDKIIPSSCRKESSSGMGLICRLGARAVSECEHHQWYHC